MSGSKSLLSKLKEIAAKQQFDRLESYLQSGEWEKMTAKERKVLSHALVEWGALQLSHGKKQAVKTFESAVSVSPDPTEVLHLEAEHYYSYKDNLRCLTLAEEALAQAIEHNSDLLKVCYLYACVLRELGIFHRQSSYFQRADQQFEHALTLTTETDPIYAELLWQWGRCWFQQAKLSGEAMDLSIAIEKFQLAEEKNCEKWALLVDHSEAMMMLAGLLGRTEMLNEAVTLAQEAVTIAPEQYECRRILAFTFSELYKAYLDGKTCRSADEAFRKAGSLNQEESLLWLRWGELLLKYGKTTRDSKFLERCCDVLQQADRLEPNHTEILGYWGEAELILGGMNEDLELLREAEKKILKSVELSPDATTGWRIYGCCLTELGRYFGDEEYYLDAIEKFQYARTLNEQDPIIWHNLALVYLSLAEHREDPHLFLKASSYCSRAFEFGGENNSRIWNDLGIILMKLAEATGEQNHVQEAVEKFEYAVEMVEEELHQNSPYVEYLYNLGCSLDFLGDFGDDEKNYERAVEMLNRAIDLDPDYHHARYNIALALSHLAELTNDIDNFKQAISYFEAMSVEDPEDEMIWSEWGLTLISMAELIKDPSQPSVSEQTFQEAETCLLRAISLGSVYAFYHLACLYSLMGHYDIAINFLERAEANHALPSLEEIMHDQWLENLKNTHPFQNFIEHVQMKRKQ